MKKIKSLIITLTLLSCSLSANIPFVKAANGLGAASSESSFTTQPDDEDVIISDKRESPEQVWWISYQFGFGNELIKAHFPTVASMETKNGLVTLLSDHKGVSYALTGFNPPRFGMDAALFIQQLLLEMNAYPYILEHYEVEFLGVNGISAFNAKYINLQTGERIRSKTVVTPFNAYTLEVVYKNHHDCDYERFFESFTCTL